MKQYTAAASRDGRFWLVHVPEIDQWTQVRTLTEIPEMATELIELMTEEPADSFEVKVVMEMPATVSEHLEHATALRAGVADAQTKAAEEYRLAARALKGSGVSLRDIGELLGVSYRHCHVNRFGAFLKSHQPRESHTSRGFPSTDRPQSAFDCLT